MKTVFCRLIEMYQRVVTIFNISCCRYYPSCSEYMKQAIENYGVQKGIIKGLGRILRCHQYAPGGYDPVIRTIHEQK